MAAARSALRIILCALALFALSAPVSEAGLVSGVLPGVVSPSDTPGSCDTTVSQPFLKVDGDGSRYVIAPGASFEGPISGWALGRGSAVVRGNEPWHVHGAADSHSLYIPAGSYAQTPAMCFALGDWHLRFFAASSSSGFSSLQVRVQVRSLLGVLSILDGGVVRANSTWQPSPRVALTLTNLTGLLATDAVSFRFVPSDSASWRIDDIYLDPWKDG